MQDTVGFCYAYVGARGDGPLWPRDGRCPESTAPNTGRQTVPASYRNNRPERDRKAHTMPGFQACPGIASFEMLYGCLSQNCENVYHVKSDTPWDAASLTVIGDEFLNWESTIACNSRHLSCALFNIHCRDLTTAAGAEIDVAPPSPVPGTNPGTPLPNNVTIAVKWVTGVAGRSFRGRTFHLGLAENQFIGNTLNGATAAGLVTAYGGLITAISSHPGKSLVVLSRRTGSSPRPAGIGTAIIRPILVDLALDSQRRRLLNHNRHR